MSSAGVDAGARWALCGGAALYLVCLTVAQRALTRGVAREKVTARGIAVVALLVLPAAGTGIEPWAFVAASALVLLALVVFEMWVFRRHQLAGRTQSV